MKNDNALKLQFIEKSKISKYAPGVDPHDPDAAPYEVVESVRELSEKESAKVLKMLDSMKRAELGELDEKIAKKRDDLKKLKEVK